MEPRFRPADDVVDTDLGEHKTALLHLVDKSYYTLNATGTVIWDGMKTGQTIAAISEELQRRYDVAESIAAASVRRLVSELVAQGLAVEVSVQEE